MAETTDTTRCSHPHRQRGNEHLASIPTTPLSERFQLVLHTEVGPVPYCGIDNERAYAAADQLGKRHMAAGTIRTYAILSDATYAASYDDDGYLDRRFALPQLVLASALAEAEQRYCVADWAKAKIVEGRF